MSGIPDCLYESMHYRCKAEVKEVRDEQRIIRSCTECGAVFSIRSVDMDRRPPLNLTIEPPPDRQGELEL